jgi:hypothetical protein
MDGSVDAIMDAICADSAKSKMAICARSQIKTRWKSFRQATNSLFMKSNLAPIALFLSAALTLSPLARAQESDPDLAKALKEAEEQSKKMNMKVPDMKEQLAEIEKDEAKEKAALQKQLEAPGPVAMPAWMPKIPQFTPAGPATKKIMDEQVHIVLTGTSPLTPAQLGDAWEAAKLEGVSRGRSNNSFNDTKTVIMYLRTQDDARQEVRLEATRAPEEKSRTLPSHLPSPGPRSISATFGSGLEAFLDSAGLLRHQPWPT